MERRLIDSRKFVSDEQERSQKNEVVEERGKGDEWTQVLSYEAQQPNGSSLRNYVS